MCTNGRYNILGQRFRKLYNNYVFQVFGAESKICKDCITKCPEEVCPCSYNGKTIGPKAQRQPHPFGPCLPCVVDPCPVLNCLVVNPCTPDEVKKYLGIHICLASQSQDA